MNEKECLDTLIVSSQDFLKESISDTEFIGLVDRLISEDIVENLSGHVAKLVNEFQDEIALYVRDEKTKKEAPGVYFGKEELKIKTEGFLKDLTSVRL